VGLRSIVRRRLHGWVRIGRRPSGHFQAKEVRELRDNRNVGNSLYSCVEGMFPILLLKESNTNSAHWVRGAPAAGKLSQSHGMTEEFLPRLRMRIAYSRQQHSSRQAHDGKSIPDVSSMRGRQKTAGRCCNRFSFSY
jgi:hypothetical protein